jgi:hypothetical protein
MWKISTFYDKRDGNKTTNRDGITFSWGERKSEKEENLEAFAVADEETPTEVSDQLSSVRLIDLIEGKNAEFLVKDCNFLINFYFL